jgi:hypothetical protein
MDDWKDELIERVMMFSTEPHHVNVTFSKHAGIYRLPITRDDFVTQMTNIADAWKSKREVRVVLRGQEVMTVGEP